MRFQEKTRRTRFGIIGSIIFPLLYAIPLMVTGDPDGVVSVLGPLGFTVWIGQWISFLIGGWMLAIVVTIALFACAGYFLGRLIGCLFDRILP